jgi:hypothetical protein
MTCGPGDDDRLVGRRHDRAGRHVRDTRRAATRPGAWQAPVDSAGLGEATVPDAGPAAKCASGHIPGAVFIPVGELGQRLAELPWGTEIASSRCGPYRVFARDAVRLVRGGGRSARRLADGMPERRLAGCPAAAGAAVQAARR